MARFQLNRKTFLLTYPQCTVTKEAMLAFLATKEEVDYAVVCKEEHQDGSPHLHAYVVYRRAIRASGNTAMRYFDFEGFHPNVQNPISASGSRQYVMKGEDYIEEGTFSADVGTGRRRLAVELENIATAAEAHALARELAPIQYVFQLQSFEYYLQRRFTPEHSWDAIPLELPTINLPDEVIAYYNRYIGSIIFKYSTNLFSNAKTPYIKTKMPCACWK